MQRSNLASLCGGLPVCRSNPCVSRGIHLEGGHRLQAHTRLQISLKVDTDVTIAFPSRTGHDAWFYDCTWSERLARLLARGYLECLRPTNRSPYPMPDCAANAEKKIEQLTERKMNRDFGHSWSSTWNPRGHHRRSAGLHVIVQTKMLRVSRSPRRKKALERRRDAMVRVAWRCAVVKHT